jgi:3-hydroxyacyl-CoA dehydrogenase / enoyl-CoA hydratase / 3-hydroxybutyryl-CoA epimerase / enoyl-CoA isomerase
MGFGRVFKKTTEGDIGVITFNVSDRPMNTWTQEAMDEFSGLMEHLERAGDIKGLLFISGKPENFHAGADLNLLNRMHDRAETAKALDAFHDAFRRLGALPFPTVAAIEGHCLGGGLEFALACTARIARDSKGTLLGLPECTLGIFPGGGGTQRLPRLIGYGAIELILKGTIMPPTKALELGIIDRVVPSDEDLLQEALRFIQGILSGKDPLVRKTHDFSQIDGVAETARKEILKATRGREIPGIMLALKSMQEGVKVSLEKGLEIERNNFLDAVLTDQAKGGIHTFFLKTMSDKPKAMMQKGFEPKPLRKVGVLGFGTMGRGIVVDVLTQTRMAVVVKDVPEAVEPGKAFVKKILEGMAEKKKLRSPVGDLLKRLTVLSDYRDAMKDADLVIEAVFEEMKAKERVYQELCSEVPQDCILASNTSSLPINAMARSVDHPERFGGLHFFSPVWLMQLVEVIQGDETSRETIDNLLNFIAALRKRPILCRDNPGFVVNAVLWPYFMDALDFLEQGTPVEKVDGAFVEFGMPLGPIKLMDEVGIDVSYHVVKGRGLEQETLRHVVGAGRLGLRKSGKGFYLKDGTVDPAVLPLIASRGQTVMSAETMQTKVLSDMITVGKDLLDRGIVNDPRMIDIGMIWGTGFPADRGGPMKWADLTGLSGKMFGKPFYPDAPSRL